MGFLEKEVALCRVGIEVTCLQQSNNLEKELEMTGAEPMTTLEVYRAHHNEPP